MESTVFIVLLRRVAKSSFMELDLKWEEEEEEERLSDVKLFTSDAREATSSKPVSFSAPSLRPTDKSDSILSCSDI